MDLIESLDIGCGGSPKGSVNLDKYYFDKNHERNKMDIIGIAENLPFRDKCFIESYAYQSLEHSENPIQFLKEMIRVSKRKIIIECPHRFSKYAKMKQHKCYFNVMWFKTVLKQFKYEISFSYESLFNFKIFQLIKRIQYIKVMIYV